MLAVKQVEIPKGEDARRNSSLQGLMMESEVLKNLDHTNIVQYLGFEQTPDTMSM